MSLVEMQSCLARLYTDAAFQKLFFLDPALSLKEYRLTPLEMQSITTLNRTRLSRFALSLMDKSRESFEKDYPLLFKVAGPHLDRAFPLFYTLNRGQAHDWDRQLLDFGSFMDRTLQADPQLPSFYSELARYERQLLNTGLKADYQGSPGEAGKTNPVISLTSRVSITSGTTCEEYTQNIIELVQLVRQDRPITLIQPETGSFIFLVYAAPGKSRPQTLELNSASRNLIELCNGELTAGEISERLGEMLGKKELEAVIMENLAELVKMGVLNA